MAPLAWSLELGGADQAAKLKYLGEALVGLDWPVEGISFLSRYLELVPDDRITRQGLDLVKRRAAAAGS